MPPGLFSKRRIMDNFSIEVVEEMARQANEKIKAAERRAENLFLLSSLLVACLVASIIVLAGVLS